MFYDQAEEDADYELNARYDYISEAYGQTARDCNDMARDDEEWDRIPQLGPMDRFSFMVYPCPGMEVNPMDEVPF